jgi:hypothetical protein
MKLRLLTTFTVGFLIGAFAMFAYVSSKRHDPVMSCTGLVKLDTASHEDLRLNNAIFIDEVDAPRGRMYLRFNSDRTMNEAIGKYVIATGSLSFMKLDNGDSITELRVNDIQ